MCNIAAQHSLPAQLLSVTVTSECVRENENVCVKRKYLFGNAGGAEERV